MRKQVTLQNINDISLELRQYFIVGNLVLLNGPMGVGKTTLLKHILYEYPVASPSFLHALTYGSDFLHIDAYTLTKERFISLSVPDSLLDKCVIIEWADLVKDILTNFLNTKVMIQLEYEQDLRFMSIDIEKGLND